MCCGGGATLTHVVVDNNGTVTTYPVSTGSLDITGSGDIDPTNTKIWFVFNDGLDFRSLYTGTTSFNECFTNSALDCGIVVSEDDSSGSPINAKVLPTFPAGNRVLIDADYPSYTNGDSSARNSWFDISIPASTIRDWYGNYAPAFTLTAKSPDPVAACTTTTTHNVSTSGTSPAPFDTWNPGDNQNWTVNLNSGATGHSFEQPGSCDSTWNASSGSEVFIIEPGTENGGDVVVEGGSATDTLDLPGFVDQYTVAASPSLPSPYVCLDTICGTEICYDDNVETVTYGTDVLACAPPPCTHTPIYPSTNPYTTTYEYEEVHVAGGVVNVDHHHTWVYGSNAIETINLDGSSISNTSCPNYTFFFHTYGGDDLVNITDSQDALGITVFSGDGNDTINVDDSQVSSVYDRIKLDLGADNDTVNIYNDAWETQVYGGDGDDTVNVYYDDNHATWSSQFCKFQGGAGTDIINFPYTATAVSYSHVSGGCYGGSHLQVLVTTASGTHPFRIDHEVESIIMNNYTVDVTSIPTSGSGTLYP
jgi:hypothetical protein